MKCENPIEEIWRIRDELGAKENYEMHQLFQRLRREEKEYANRVATPIPVRKAKEEVISPH
jgi:hypothetical protein